MSLALATRGYCCTPGIEPGVLAYLYPESAIVRQGAQLGMVVVLTSEAYGDTVVALSSDDPAVIAVPASVTVLDGFSVAMFYATAGALGAARITASLDSVERHSDISVMYVDASLRPTIRKTVDLKPRGISAQNLKPDVVQAEDQSDAPVQPKVAVIKNLKPRGRSARALKPKIYDTEES